MIELATETGLLSPISNRFSKLCCSLYADDAALFINPTKEDLETVAEILDLFGKASGLVTNRLKSAAYPIRCEGLDLDEILEGFSCPVQTFPCTYLGLPLHYKQLRRVNFQPLIDKMANRLPLWKGKFLNRAGRLKLLNTSLSTIHNPHIPAHSLCTEKMVAEKTQQISSWLLVERLRRRSWRPLPSDVEESAKSQTAGRSRCS
jgi:hypothetical protein